MSEEENEKKPTLDVSKRVRKRGRYKKSIHHDVMSEEENEKKPSLDVSKKVRKRGRNKKYIHQIVTSDIENEKKPTLDVSKKVRKRGRYKKYIHQIIMSEEENEKKPTFDVSKRVRKRGRNKIVTSEEETEKKPTLDVSKRVRKRGRNKKYIHQIVTSDIENEKKPTLDVSKRVRKRGRNKKYIHQIVTSEEENEKKPTLDVSKRVRKRGRNKKYIHQIVTSEEENEKKPTLDVSKRVRKRGRNKKSIHDDVMSEEENEKKPTLDVSKRVRKRGKYKKKLLTEKVDVQRRSTRLLVSDLKTSENKCLHCGLSLSRRYLLLRHISNAHQISVYKCANCDEVFRRKDDLLRHSRYVHGKRKKKKPVALVCDKCDLSFESREALRNHDSSAHFLDEKKRRKDYKCSKCSDTFEKMASFIHHMKTTHNAPYPCTKCQITFKYKACLSKHFVMVHGLGKKKHMCGECQKTFLLKCRLRKHYRDQHGMTVAEFPTRVSRRGIKLETTIQDDRPNLLPHKCSKCDETFSMEKQLLKHMESTHESVSPVKSSLDNSFSCLNCKVDFDYEHKLVKHNATQTHLMKVSEDLLCSICKDVFSSPEQLDEHYRSSHKLKRFKCSHCSVSYNLKVHLVCHLRRRHGYSLKKTHACRKCRVAFEFKSALQRHILTHRSDKVKPFRCSLCVMSFHLQSTLDNHKLYFHKLAKSKQYICSKCGKSFPQEENLSKHLCSDLSLSKLFKCAVCNSVFNQQSELNEHFLLTNHDLGSQTKKQSILEQVCDNGESSALNHEAINSISVECSNTESALTSEGELEEHVSTFRDKKLDVSDGLRLNHLKCSDCTISFTTKRSLDVHAREAHGKSTLITFKCAKCVKTFGSKTELNKHFKKIHKIIINSFQCTHCDSAFKEERVFLEHLRTHQTITETNQILTNDASSCSQNFVYRPKYIGPTSFHEIPVVRSVANILRPFKCMHCKATFDEKDSFTKHIQSHTARRKMITFDCFKCNDVFNTQGLLNEHTKAEHESIEVVAKIVRASFVCKYCDRAFTEECTMVKHVQACHEEGMSWKCTKCDNAFKTEEQLENHDKTKHAIKIQSIASLRHIYKCSDCNFFSSGEIDVANHVQEEHGILGVFECLTCHECFESKLLLEDHKILHRTSEDVSTSSSLLKKFECTKSQFVDCTESALASHNLTSQTSVKRHKCLKCVDIFNSQMDLDKHVATVHSVIKSLKCPYCEAAFIMESSLTKHIETSHDEICVLTEGKNTKDFSCYHCIAEFCKEDDLVKHILLFHNIIKPFQCNHCQNYFSNKTNLREHIFAVHNPIILIDEEMSVSPKCPQSEILKIGTEQSISDSDNSALRPYLCEECGGAFSSIRYLLKHTHSVHQKPSDTQADDGVEVIFSCIKTPPKIDKPYKCSLCKSAFSEKYRLSFHALAVHKIELGNC